MMVDEADIDIVGAASSTSKGGPKRTSSQSDGGGSSSPRPWPHKRKPGPIPKDVFVRRPPRTPPSSPASASVIEDANNQAASTLSVDASASSTSPNVSPDSSIPPCSNTSEKLMNGLAEMPTIPVYEPIPVEHVDNMDTSPPVLTPIDVNNIDTPKIEVKNERTDNARNECGRLPVNDCIESGVRVTDSAAEDRLTNHVQDKRESKSERERKLTKEELEDIRRHNLNIRDLVYKEVRRRGTSKSWINKSLLLRYIRRRS